VPTILPSTHGVGEHITLTSGILITIYNKTMGPIGIQELVVIMVVALLIFGPKKLPELGRSIGKTLAEFRRASNEIKTNIRKELEEPDRE
jgi:TatA/E family protein of Tat protein translocase